MYFQGRPSEMSRGYTLHFFCLMLKQSFEFPSTLFKEKYFSSKCCLKMSVLKEIHGFVPRFNPRHVMSSPKTHPGNLLKSRPCKNPLTDFCTSEHLIICKSPPENFHMVSTLDPWCLPDLTIKNFLQVSRRILN